MRVQTGTQIGTRPSLHPPRLQLARAFYSLALLLMPACLIATPWGLTPAACCTLVALVLAADRVWAARTLAGGAWWAMTAAVLLVMAVVVASVLIHHDDWKQAADRLRIVMIPVAWLMVLALAPPPAALWAGAVLGLAGACVVAVLQIANHAPRAEGWNNAITFADMAALLLPLVLFLRPADRFLMSMLAACAGLVAIGLSGTRGAWPAAALVVMVAVVMRAASGRRHRLETGILVVLGLLSVVAVLPQVQQRTQALQTDLLRYAAGDRDSSSGARIELLRLAGQELQRHPWTGAGLGHFGRVVAASPQCQVRQPDNWCRLGHAHSDFPEWGATMGVPGVLALLLLYGLPAWLFARQLRVQALALRTPSAALTGLAVVGVFVLCGLSQSMWAHQISGSTYLLLVGILLGFSGRADPRKA